MEFDEFLKQVSSTIGPDNALDLSRDIRLQALEEILIRYCNVSRNDIDMEVKKRLAILAEQILKMPPLQK